VVELLCASQGRKVSAAAGCVGFFFPGKFEENKFSY
jgi:hypothetical protein